MSKANANGQNYANLKNIWHHQKYMKQYNIINDPTYPFVDNSIINSPNPTGWGQYSGKHNGKHNGKHTGKHTGKNSCGCDVELKSSMVENMCASCNSSFMLTYDHMTPIDRLAELDLSDQSDQSDPSAHTSQTVQTPQTQQSEQSEQISNQLNATKATTKSTNQDIKKKKETYFSPLTHDFCNATKGGKKLAF